MGARVMIIFEAGDVFVVRDRHSLVVCDARDKSTKHFPINHSGRWEHVRQYAVELANETKKETNHERILQKAVLHTHQ